MADTIFQRLYDAFKNYKAPEWLVDFLGKLQEILLPILLQIGKEYVEAIKGKIIEVSAENIANEEKFKKVFDYIKTELKITHLKDSAINLAIESLVNYLKKERTI